MGGILYLRLARENVYRPAGPAVCKTRQARLRRSMVPRQAKPVRTPIASSNPLPGPATGAHRSAHGAGKGAFSTGNKPLRDPANVAGPS